MIQEDKTLQLIFGYLVHNSTFWKLFLSAWLKHTLRSFHLHVAFTVNLVHCENSGYDAQPWRNATEVMLLETTKKIHIYFILALVLEALKQGITSLAGHHVKS